MSAQATDSIDPAWVASIIQISDPLFPTGAYAHSLGLEQWAKDSAITRTDELIDFFKHHAGPSLAHWELPYLRYAIKAVAEDNWSLLEELEQELDATKWASELRDASIAQGRGRLRMLEKLYPSNELISEYKSLLAGKKVWGHHSIVSALQYKILGIPETAGLSTYGYQNLANFVSASIKLLRISPEAGQLALTEGLRLLPEWIRTSQQIERDQAGWFAPAFDIASARHRTAFSRLFIS
ncbi:MAG: urease accessory protein UreF [Opitutales bacterium]